MLTEFVAWVRRRRRAVEAVITLALVLSFVVLYVGGNAYRQDLATLAIIYSFLAIGLYVPLFLTGSLSLAYNVYFAVGAYSVAVIATRTTWPPYVTAIPIALALSVLIAFVVGFVTRQLTGFHMAVATLLVAVAGEHFLRSTRSVTGGPEGIAGIPPPIILGEPMSRFAILVFAALAIWLVAQGVRSLQHSLVGVTLRVQREAPLASEAAGISTQATNIVCLCLGAAIASLAGVVLVAINQFVLPESFSLSLVFLVLFMPVLGGQGSPWGAVVGAIVVLEMTNALTFLEGPGALTFGIASLLVLLLLPGGLLGLLAAAGRRVGGVRRPTTAKE